MTSTSPPRTCARWTRSTPTRACAGSSPSSAPTGVRPTASTRPPPRTRSSPPRGARTCPPTPSSKSARGRPSLGAGSPTGRLRRRGLSSRRTRPPPAVGEQRHPPAPALGGRAAADQIPSGSDPSVLNWCAEYPFLESVKVFLGVSSFCPVVRMTQARIVTVIFFSRASFFWLAREMPRSKPIGPWERESEREIDPIRRFLMPAAFAVRAERVRVRCAVLHVRGPPLQYVVSLRLSAAKSLTPFWTPKKYRKTSGKQPLACPPRRMSAFMSGHASSLSQTPSPSRSTDSWRQPL